jgi:hypothetical protein
LGVEVELWTRDVADLASLLPRADEWERSDDFFELDGDGWLVSVEPPEEVDPTEVPPELGELADDVRYRIGLSVEPSDPGPAAWAFVRQTMESVGRALGGVGVDPESGHPRSWAEPGA